MSTRPGHRTTIARLTGDVSAAETVAFVDHARAHGFTVHVIAVRTEPDATTSSSTARGGSAHPEPERR